VARVRDERKLIIGGRSMGGRAASMLAADGFACDGLLLLAYPLHAPGRPQHQRSEHFPRIRTPALFVHGTKDPFGTIPELEAARATLGAPSALLRVDNAGHDLGRGRTEFAGDVPGRLLALLG
jgi:predicted alpha/beta-hydrolase family hydrolase